MNNAKLKSLWQKHRHHIAWVALYLACFTAITYIFYLRFPNSYNSPNFFGEDGSVFTNNVMRHGFWDSLFLTFNGYYIWGIYLVLQFGRGINSLFFSGQFIDLPRSYAVASYLFWAFCSTLPLILLRKYLRWPYLVLLSALMCFVPASGWDYQIIGTLGNFKFIYVYIAFLLMLYRFRLHLNSRKVLLVDLALLICGYTNVTVYLMVPFLLLQYRKEIGRLWRKPVRLLKQNFGLSSLVGLGVLLIPQLIIIKIYGIPKIPGYLYAPFDMHRAIEILVHRPYLYSVSYAFTKHFNDIRAIIAFAVLCLAIYALRNKRATPAVLFGMATITVTTLLFVINRPGVAAFFFGYKSGGPAQFFFTQNMIFYVVATLLLASLVEKISIRLVKVLLFITFGSIIIGQYASASSYGNNDFMQRGVGTIYATAQHACATSHSNLLAVTIYPTVAQTYGDIPRKLLCTEALADHQPSEINLKISATGAHYLGLGTTPATHFTQTFLSTQPQLNGIDIYASTFTQTIKTPYMLKLYDASCRNQLRQVKISSSSLVDNQYDDIFFKPITNSRDKIYCFTIEPTVNDVKTPLAIWLSLPNQYSKGVLRVGGVSSQSTVVFNPRYKDTAK